MANSYLDYNFFNKIAQQSNYEKKVAIRDKELEYAQQLEARANKRVQEQMINQDKVAEYVDQLTGKMEGLLGPDAARLKELEKQQRQAIIQGVANAQGDYTQFLLQGGAGVLRDYKRSVLNSEEATVAFNNKATMDDIKESMKKGHIFKNVNVTYTDDKGREVMESMEVEDMLNLFYAGKVKNLKYNGSQEAKDINPWEFFHTPNPDNPYESDFARLDQVEAILRGKGQDPEIATKLARQYASFERDGQIYSSFQWGSKERDFTGLDKLWNKNSGAKAGAGKHYKAQEKYGDYLGAVLTENPTGAISKKDWLSMDGKVKRRISIEDKFIDADAMDAILSASGLFLGDEGHSGKFTNTIGFTNMKTGRIANIPGSEYDLVGVNNNLKIVRDIETGQPQMYIEATINVTEDYAEESLGEPWWGGNSQHWSNVTRDVDVDGNDMRQMTVGVNIPLSPMIKERVNQKIAWEQGQVVGSTQQQDYVGGYYSAPQGAQVIDNETFTSMNGNVLSTKTPFGGGYSDADLYKRVYSQMVTAMKTDPRFRYKSQEEIRILAEQKALDAVSGNR